MGNAFDVNKSVAQAYVRSEQIKGWFLSNAKMLLVILSGCLLFLGVVSLAWGDRPFAFDASVIPTIISVIPMACVGGLLAICIEGGTVFSSAMRKEAFTKVRQELSVLEKARSKYRMKDEDYAARKRKIEKGLSASRWLMFTCAFFSVMGAEIFWQRLFANAEWYYHIIGGVLGVVCSVLLIIFELNGELVERVIEKSISSSGLIQIALDQSAKSQIHDQLFEMRSAKLASPEFTAIMEQGAEQGLLGVVVEAVRMAGMNVSANQLQTMVKEIALQQKGAEQFIASGGEDVEVPQLPAPPVELNKKRVSKHRKTVEQALSKYGEKRIVDDLPGMATELGMDQRTLERNLKAILSEQRSA